MDDDAALRAAIAASLADEGRRTARAGPGPPVGYPPVGYAPPGYSAAPTADDEDAAFRAAIAASLIDTDTAPAHAVPAQPWEAHHRPEPRRDIPSRNASGSGGPGVEGMSDLERAIALSLSDTTTGGTGSGGGGTATRRAAAAKPAPKKLKQSQKHGDRGGGDGVVGRLSAALAKMDGERDKGQVTVATTTLARILENALSVTNDADHR